MTSRFNYKEWLQFLLADYEGLVDRVALDNAQADIEDAFLSELEGDDALRLMKFDHGDAPKGYLCFMAYQSWLGGGCNLVEKGDDSADGNKVLDSLLDTRDVELNSVKAMKEYFRLLENLCIDIEHIYENKKHDEDMYDRSLIKINEFSQDLLNVTY
jgi:hypothetical protein